MSKDADAAPPPPTDYDPLTIESVSAPVAAMGGRLAAWSDGFARLEADVSPAYLNRAGFIHGGAHMLLLDTAAGYAGCYCPYPGRYRRSFTISLNTNFIGAVSSGSLIAEGRVVGGGRRIFFAEARVESADGQLLATAAGAFRYVGGGGALWGDPRPETAPRAETD